jgi:hypothetical protein
LDTGGTGAPDGNGYTKIYSNGTAFVAVKADGSITAWGADPGGITRINIYFADLYASWQGALMRTPMV